jgi:hypothetical protein
MAASEYVALLRVLAQQEVEFIVVGGVSAHDLSVLYRKDAKNIQRVLAALERLEARFRMRPDLSPNALHLEYAGHKLLTTNLGQLDMLGAIGKRLAYEDLIEHTDEGMAGEFRVRMLRPEKPIAFRQDLSVERDLSMLPIFRLTLPETRRLR